jgi:4-hydroxybenzoate polyprenyltransferase
VFLDRRTGLTDRFNALRPAHWLKNLLILFPLFAAGRFHETAMLEKALLAFAAFGCCASSGYLFNDLTDLPADRHHPLKRSRPFAAGVVPLSYGFLMMPVLFTAGSALGVLVSPLFLAIVFAYFATSVAYSLYVKRIALLDVLSLAGLYSLRLIAGFTAVAIRPSHWLLAFSMFLFFSLALVKRYAELEVMRCTEGKSARARGYELGDRELIETMGMASGYVAVLLLALYIAGDTAQILYAHRIFLWPLCPLLLYWVSHIWLTVHRGRMRDDPVVFAATDRTSVALLSLMLLAAIRAV